MDASERCRPFSRRMHPWEIEEARRVFRDRLDYDRVRIHECSPWPNRIDGIGRWLKRMPQTGHANAITLGNHCIFPVRLPDHPVSPQDFEHYLICWLIHELTHAWQYQQMGWRYLLKALSAQFKDRGAAYDFGGEEGLKQRRAANATIHSFNLEQQGDIARTYYQRLCLGKDVSAFIPYIEDIHSDHIHRV